MPVAHQPVQVSLTDVLQVRAGALTEPELWSVLCQSAEAVQDIFVRGAAVSEGLPSFVISPYTLLLCPSGRVQFAESVDTSRPDIRDYLPPEVLARKSSLSNAAIEKLFVYSLGMTIFWAAKYGQSRDNLSHKLNAVLTAMCDQNAASRVPLMNVLESCSLHAQRGHTGLPYSHNVLKLSKTVLGSVYELDKLFASNHEHSTDEYDASLPNRQYSSMPSEHLQNSGRNSPGKRQLRNGHDSYSQKRSRSNRSRHNRDNYAYSEVQSRSQSLNRNSSNSTHRDYRHLSSSSTNGSYNSCEDLRLSHRAIHGQSRHANRTVPGEDSGHSYHISDIFSPSVVSHKSSVPPSIASERSRSPHVRDISGRPLSSPHSRHSVSPHNGQGSRRSHASLVYERLRERRERLSLLREQLGFHDPQDQEPLRPLPNFHSDTETLSDDGSDRVQKSDGRCRSAKSLNSASSAQEGSYYPDQYSHYASAGTLPSELETSSSELEDMEYHGNERPDLQPSPSVVLSTEILPLRPRSLPSQAANQQNGSLPNNRKPKKKFLGPEFAETSSKPNEYLDLQPSFLCKTGKTPPDRMQITVVLLNGRRLDLMCDLGTLGNEMYNMVALHMGIQETYYFGLAYIKDGEYLFVDPDEKLFKIGPESWKEAVKKKSKKVNSRDKFTLFFRVKFYIENTAMLRDPRARHQYYLQLRKDILEERTTCDDQVALQLASLALQAEMGDYYPESMGQNYFLPEHYIATAAIDILGVPEIRKRVPSLHEMHQGMDELQAELEFLMEARKLPEYGIHFHRVTQSKKDNRTSIWYGICARGLILYEKRGNTRIQIHAHPWQLTRKIAFNRKKFSIEPNDGSHQKILHFTDNYKKGRYLLKMCQAQHKFQMTMRSKAFASQQFCDDFNTSAAQFENSFSRSYDAMDGLSDDFNDPEESFPNSPRSSTYQDDYQSNFSQRNTNYDAIHKPSKSIRIGNGSRHSEQPNKELTNQRSRQDIPKASRMPQMRSQSMNRDYTTEDPRYASIGEVMRSKSADRSSKILKSESADRSSVARHQLGRLKPAYLSNVDLLCPSPQEDMCTNILWWTKTENDGIVQLTDDDLGSWASPLLFIGVFKGICQLFHLSEGMQMFQSTLDSKLIPGNNGYYGNYDDTHNAEPNEGLPEMADPYVIDASIRTHERTYDPYLAEDNNIISETLREKLTELPASEQPERETTIITLKQDSKLGLGFTIVGGENSRSMDLGIFVQSVTPGGPAEHNGRIQPGDRIISINRKSLEGVSHRVAVKILRDAEDSVQLILSQPKSASPVPELHQTPHEVVGDVIYAKVNKPLNSRPQLTVSEPSLESKSHTVQSGSVKRHKSTPPRKPIRRPESFGSNYSWSDAEKRTPPQVTRIVSPYLTVNGASSITQDQDSNEDTQDESRTQQDHYQGNQQNDYYNQYQNGHLNQYHNGHHIQYHNGHHNQYHNGHLDSQQINGKQQQDNRVSLDLDLKDVRSNCESQENFSIASGQTGDPNEVDDVMESASESKVPTPGSSDIEDFFPDDDDNAKPHISFHQDLMVSPILARDIPQSPYDQQQEMGRESALSMSATSTTETERGSTLPKDNRGTEDLKPGERFHVHLTKLSGSLGISVTGGVNTSVKHGGIYIKSMVSSGAAARDGNIQIGDRVLDVNRESLVGVTHKQAVETLRRAPLHCTLIIERGLPPTESASTLPPTPAPSPLVGIGENGEPAIFVCNQPMQQLEVATSSDVVTSPEKTTSTTRTTDQSHPISTGPSSELPVTSPTSHESDSSTPIPTSSVASPMTTSNVVSPNTASNIPSPATTSNIPSPATTFNIPSPATTAKISSPATTASISPPASIFPSVVISNVGSPASVLTLEQAASSGWVTEEEEKGGHVSQFSAFSDESIPCSDRCHISQFPPLSSDPLIPPAKERCISEVSTTQQSHLSPSDANFSDSDSDIPLPSDDESFQSKQVTPAIQVLQRAYDDEGDQDSVVSSELHSETPEPSEDEDEGEYDEDEDSYLSDRFDPEFTSPALSTHEADTLTPTTHLFGRVKPTRGVYGIRLPSQNVGAIQLSPLSVSASESWLDSPPDSPPPPPPESPPPTLPQSPPPMAPPQPAPQTSLLVVPSTSVVPTRSPSVQNVPSPFQRTISPQSQLPNTSHLGDYEQRPNSSFSVQSPLNHSINNNAQSLDPVDIDRIRSPGFSTDDASPVPMFGSSGDESLPLSRNLSRSSSPDFGTTFSSMGALTLSQTALGSTMGLETDIELPDLPHVNPENTFEVQLTKGAHGLGFSVQGGRGLHKDPKLCLVRVKKIFPGSPASRSDMMEEGDFILAVNDTPVHHLNHDEVVSVLRGALTEVRLLLCRPSEEELEALTLQQEEKAIERRMKTKEMATVTSSRLTPRSPLNKEASAMPFSPPFTPEDFSPPNDDISGPPSSRENSDVEEVPVLIKSAIPVRSKSVVTPPLSEDSSMSFPTVKEQDTDYLDITLIKPTRGGFGFTVAGGANSGGCYIKDILHDPALSDGRLRKGDKLLSVNSTDLKGMSHFDAVSFLRKAPQEVTLRICRNFTRPENVATLLPPHSASKKMFPADVALSSRSNTPFISTQELPVIRIKRNAAGHLGMFLTLDLRGRKQGIYVGDITPGLPAEIEGSVKTGDEIHTISGRSLSGVGLLEARRVLDQAASLVNLQLTRNGQPVYPVERSTQSTPASTVGSVHHQTPHAATSKPPLPTFPPPEDVPEINAKEFEKPLASNNVAIEERLAAATKNKLSTRDELDLDLGAVSVDESWEDFTDDNDGGNSMKDIEAILAVLDTSNSNKHHIPKTSREDIASNINAEVMFPKADMTSSPSSVNLLKEKTSSTMPWTSSGTSSSVPLTQSRPSFSVPQTLSGTSGDDDMEGTSHYSKPRNQSESSPDDDSHKSPTAQCVAVPTLTPIAVNESFAFTPFHTPKEHISEVASPVSVASATVDDAGRRPRLTDHESPMFSGSPAEEYLQNPMENAPTQADTFNTPVGRNTLLDTRTTPNNRLTPGKELEPLKTKSEGGVMWIDLMKPPNGSLGFSLTGGMKGGKTTILVKTITPEGAAEVDGRLKIGDRILQVNGQSFVGMTQNKAVGILRKCKGKVTVAIARQMPRSASHVDVGPQFESTQPSQRQQGASYIQSVTESARDAHTKEDLKSADLHPSTTSLAADHSTGSEPTASLALDLGLVGGEAITSEDSVTEPTETTGSVNFDSSLSLPISDMSSEVVTPPVEFSDRCDSPGHDTDSDIDDANDLPKDSLPNKDGSVIDHCKKLGQKSGESDNYSLFIGSDTANSLFVGRESAATAPRGAPSNKNLSVISDAELQGMAVFRPVPGGRYSGSLLKNAIATLQKQIDEQVPVEEYKALRQDLTRGSYNEANKPINKDKNRYRNVLPYDQTRVVIQEGFGSDYINGSHIQVHVGKDTYHYIACQGPLPNTTADLWQMVWEQRADVIAMVTLDVENGKVKCHRYWPDNMESPLMVGDRFQLCLNGLQTLEHFDIRKISMTDIHTKQINHVSHLNYTTWPDHGVPSSALPLLQYTRYMRRIHTNGPIVVHCSAGIGRTGTLITIDTIMGLIDRDEQFKIIDIVKDVRSQRQGMIQTKNQYAFCYKTVLEALKTI